MTSSKDEFLAIAAPDHAMAARHVYYHSTASLTFLVWNTIVVLDEEVQYIWAMRHKNPFKWVYFFLRYGVILAHVTHNFFIERLGNGSNPPLLCSAWFIYVLTLSQTLATLLELILAARVFALYNRSRRIAFTLLILILVEAGGTVRILSLQHTPSFHGTCLLMQGTSNYSHQSILAFTVHCTIIGLTWGKYFFARRAGWGRTPLVSLVVRDGSTVYATMILLVISVAVTCGLQNERAVAVIFWTTSLFSFSGCRMILSMERFARRQPSTEAIAGQQLFTSQVHIGTLDFGTTGNHQYDSNTPPLMLQLHDNIS